MNQKHAPADNSRITGHLAREFGGVSLPLKVLPSPVGYYLGTLDHDGAPYSRESEEYWKTREDAEVALKSPSPRAWTQRRWP